MKNSIILAFLIALSCTFSCKKDCSQSQNPVCNEVGPPLMLCGLTMNYARWFYNATTRSCDVVNYVGCAESGFATKSECECQCR
jgi:hypothetical protein